MQRQSSKFILFFLSLFFLSVNLFSQQINSDVLYKLVSPSGLVLDNTGTPTNSAQLYLSKDKKGNEGQVWKITKLENGYYTITNPFINKNIDNDNVTSGNGNVVVQWDASNSNENQQWKFAVTGTGAYAVTHKKQWNDFSFYRGGCRGIKDISATKLISVMEVGSDKSQSSKRDKSKTE